MKCVIDQFDDTMKEVYPQTARERQIEMQLTSVIHQIQSRTSKAKDNLKKLHDEYQQAAATLQLYQDGCRTNVRCDVFQMEEIAKQKLRQLKLHRQSEQNTLDCYHRTRERLLLGESDGFGGLDRARKSHEDATVRIEKLRVDSQREVSEYKDCVAYQSTVWHIVRRTLGLEAEFDIALDKRVRKALDRPRK